MALIFVHTGPIPNYLLYAIENARVFNPDCSIYLIGDRSHHRLDQLKVECVPIESVDSPRHQQFLQNYEHISSLSEPFERFCFSRWFFVDQLIETKGLHQAVHLDSDCMLFCQFDHIVSKLERWKLAMSMEGGPHCAFLNGGTKGLTDSILRLFTDPSERKRRREFYEQGVQSGQNHGLNDMVTLREYVYSHPSCCVDYSNLHNLGGIFEHSLDCSHGFQMKGRRKRILWQQEDGMLIPYLQRIDTRERVRALCLHFKGGCKRRMAPFNRAQAPSGALNLLPWLRKWEFNLPYWIWRGKTSLLAAD